MTTGFDELRSILRRWDARRRRAELLRRLPQGLLLGPALGLAAALISRARPWLTRSELAQIAVLLAVVMTALAALLILARRRSTADQARFADRQFRLRERMITAVEIAQGDLLADDAIAARQLRDALEAAGGVDAARGLPLAFRPVDWLAPLGAAALLAFVLWLPNPMEAVLLEQRAVAALVEEQATALADLSETIAANEALTPQQRETLLRPLDDAQARLAEPNVGREEAVAALSGAEAELRQLSREFDIPALDAMGAALGEQGPAAELARALEADDAAQAAMAATSLADSLNELSPEARAELSQQLAAAADSATAGQTVTASLARAAEALEAGDAEAAREALEEAAAMLAESATTASAAEQATQAADQLGQSRQAMAGNDAGPGDAGGENAAQSGESSGSNGEGEGTGNGGAQPGTGASTEGGGHVENVFVPDSVPLNGEGEAVGLETQCLTDSESCEPAAIGPSSLPPETAGGQLIPYNRVFGDYRSAAFEALGQGNIPVRLEGLIRDYFTALEP